MSQERDERTLEACLQELHLATMRRQYEAVARQAQQESWSYPDFLRELAEREVQQRQQNRIDRLLKASRLPLEKNWASLDLKRLPAKAVQQLRSLLAGDFLDRRENVLVFGTVGSGKTHACVRWPRNWCGNGPAHPVHDDQPAGAGTAEGQAGPALKEIAEATEPLGGLADRRPGLCAAEPGGDGGAVHAAGGALRAGQRAGDEQPGVLAVGTDLQGPDDDGGGDRPAGASQRDRGAERAELPSGGGQESQGATAERSRPRNSKRAAKIGREQGPPCGEETAAARRGGLSPLRSPPLRS